MNLLDRISKIEKRTKRILVIGDIMLDQYEYGLATRISPEAPLPVIEFAKQTYIPGGAANVANNLVALGAEVVLVGLVGNDLTGEILKKSLRQESIGTKYILTDPTRPTTVKRRIYVGDTPVSRIDYETIKPISRTIEKNACRIIAKSLPSIDAVVISDYAKGFLNRGIIAATISSARPFKKPIIVDCKPKSIKLYNQVTLVKPNLKEAKEMTGISDDIEQIGQTLIDMLDSNVFITMGDKGIYVFENKGKHLLVPTKKAVRLHDVTGAGDTVTAISALGFVNKLNLFEIAELANTGGRLVVQKPGTATVTWNEIRNELDSISIRESYERHEKEWGHEEWIVNLEGAGYCSKKLVLRKGYQCSIHYHKEKDEAFYINQGYVLLFIDGKENLMKPGSRIRIPPETKHRFIGLTDAEIFEISTYHKDEDSYRDEPSGKVNPKMFDEYLKKYNIKEKRE